MSFDLQVVSVCTVNINGMSDSSSSLHLHTVEINKNKSEECGTAQSIPVRQVDTPINGTVL